MQKHLYKNFFRPSLSGNLHEIQALQGRYFKFSEYNFAKLHLSSSEKLNEREIITIHMFIILSDTFFKDI